MRLSRRAVLGGAAALAAPRIASAQGSRVLKFVPHADLTVVDPSWTTAYITRNHAMMAYDTLFGTDNAGEDDLWRFYNVTRGRDYIHLMFLRKLERQWRSFKRRCGRIIANITFNDPSTRSGSCNNRKVYALVCRKSSGIR